MKTLQVYDPPMCCSTGLCGPEVDPVLVQFAALLAQLGREGAKVERYNLGQQPLAFVQNPRVKSLLDAEGMACLPLLLVEGAVHLKGRYPTESERESLVHALKAGDAGGGS